MAIPLPWYQWRLCRKQHQGTPAPPVSKVSLEALMGSRYSTLTLSVMRKHPLKCQQRSTRQCGQLGPPGVMRQRVSQKTTKIISFSKMESRYTMPKMSGLHPKKSLSYQQSKLKVYDKGINRSQHQDDREVKLI